MNAYTKGATAMLDRSHAEAILARVAVAAFTHYPDKAAQEVGYTVDEDVDWVMQKARAMDPSIVAEWRTRIAEVILNPDADRRTFIADLMALAEG